MSLFLIFVLNAVTQTVVMLCDLILTVIMLSVIMLTVVMLSAVMLTLMLSVVLCSVTHFHWHADCRNAHSCKAECPFYDS